MTEKTPRWVCGGCGASGEEWEEYERHTRACAAHGEWLRKLRDQARRRADREPPRPPDATDSFRLMLGPRSPGGLARKRYW